jgi:hypothetical protein
MSGFLRFSEEFRKMIDHAVRSNSSISEAILAIAADGVVRTSWRHGCSVTGHE